MFGRTNPLNQRLTRKQKRTMAIVCAAVLLVFVGLGIWGSVASDSYSTSANGCINVTLPGSTGGAVLHYCGADARNFCHSSSVVGQSQLAVRARPAVPPGGPASGEFGLAGSVALTGWAGTALGPDRGQSAWNGSMNNGEGWAILAVDPGAARRRREEAQRDARVMRWRENAGTAALCGRDLPSADVLAADLRISARARELKAAGLAGTMDGCGI